MAQTPFDLVVIGSGPAGHRAALTAAKLGRRVAVIDRAAMVGGVCIHTGTIPSKAMREAVLHLTAHNERHVYGAGYAVKHDITMSDLIARSDHVIRSETAVVENQMRRNGVGMFFGDASFLDAHTVRVVRGQQVIDLEGHNIMIATGTEPARPANVPFTPGRILDSNEILSMKDLPRSMIIVGGGVIGCEYASMLAAVGVKVSLIEGRNRLLEFVDDEICEALQFRLRDTGVRLRLGEKVASIRFDGKNVEAELESNKVLRADTLMYAIGRQGATDKLALERAGLKADERGRLKVNDYYQTDVPHIYAAGDVIGFPALAATSVEQGRLAACYMFKQLVTSDRPSIFPYGIYTIPEISMIGQTEQQLTQSKTPYEVGLARYREIARGQLIGDPNGLLKLIFHPHSRRLLGVHAIGTGATEIIHIGQAVMTAGMPIDYFVETVFNFPTLAECYKVAARDGLNRIRNSLTIDTESFQAEAVADSATTAGEPSASREAA